jgi:hypothetical protein
LDERNQMIARGMRAGLRINQIALHLGISSPAVCQRIRRSPELRRLRRCTPQAVAGLRRYRDQLQDAELDAKAVARRIRRALRSLDEEIALAAIEELLAS